MIISKSLYQNDNFSIFKDLGLTLLFNTLIAGFLTYIYGDNPFFTYLVISQCIGLSIFILCRGCIFYFKPEKIFNLGLIVTAAIIVGGLAGGFAGFWLSGVEIVNFTEHRTYSIRILILSLMFGGVISFYFFSRKMIMATEQLLQEERIQRLISEKQAVQTQLKMLQAQIEPHFLFNTLSNILSLLDNDVPKGKLMLQDLARYLRVSLAETRSQRTTLGGELELAASYLNIFKVRMGDRLEVRIDVDEALKSAVFCPMLLQPLVENAILHGLDAMIAGGIIHIHGERQGTLLRVTVADTGKGFDYNKPQGMGLANVRDRLRALHGKQGRLIIGENQPTGVRAIIEVPYATNH